MKYHKKMIWLFSIALFFVSNAYAMKKPKQQYYYFSYLSHPTTLLCAGITSLGGYCLYNREASLQAYEWLKQRFDEVPGIVKIGGFGLGIWAWYTLWFNKKRPHSFTSEQETPTINEHAEEHSASEKESQEGDASAQKTKEELKVSLVPLEKEKQDDIEKINVRLKALEESVVDLQVFFAAFEAQYKQDAIKINNRMVQLEETNEQNETLKKESITFFEEIVDNIESLKKPSQLFDQDKDNDEMEEKEARKKINYIVVPEEVLINFGNRMSNIEIVVLGEVTTPKSFGVGAQLKPSRIDSLEQSLAKNEKTLGNIEKIVKSMFTKKPGNEKRKSLTTTKKLLPSPSAGRGSPRNKGDEVEKDY